MGENVNGEHTKPVESRTEDLVRRLRSEHSHGLSDDAADEIERLRAEVERLREVVTIPLITPEAPPGFYFRVLAEHEKGQPVNAQDLINALMWRVRNQRKEIALLHKRIETLHELVHT